MVIQYHGIRTFYVQCIGREVVCKIVTKFVRYSGTCEDLEAPEGLDPAPPPSQRKIKTSNLYAVNLLKIGLGLPLPPYPLAK